MVFDNLAQFLCCGRVVVGAAIGFCEIPEFAEVGWFPVWKDEETFFTKDAAVSWHVSP
jgi:hypothetical protein